MTIFAAGTQTWESNAKGHWVSIEFDTRTRAEKTLSSATRALHFE
jgi:hypothetical protein